MNSPRVVIAGGTGFLGGTLRRHFAAQGREVIVLSRTPNPAAHPGREVDWDGRTVGAWAELLEGASLLLNLAGYSVNCRYHERNRQRIMDSRVEPTLALGQALARCSNPPPLWMNASTATIYRHTFGPPWDEEGETGGTPEAKDAFSVEVARAWEAAFFSAARSGTRQLALRMAMVLGHGRNSVFPVMRRLARFGLGGRMGDGRQYMSWIHEADLCRALDFLIAHEELSGIVNLAAPQPLPNADFMKHLRAACGVPFGLPAARWMLELGAFFLRTETELLLKSRRVVPARLTRAGFLFTYPEISPAFQALLAQPFG